MPHITDELYSCLYEDEFNKLKSISARGNCANADDFEKNGKIEEIGEVAKLILSEVRKYKSEKNISIKEIIESIEVYCNYDLSGVLEDLKNVCNVNNIIILNSEEFKINF